MRTKVTPAGPSRATAEPGKPFSWGPITTSQCAEIETPRERKRGERCPITIRIGLWGSVVSSPTPRSPSGFRGGAPAENGCYAYSRSERSHLGNPFQYFERWRGLQNVTGPGKTPPPLSAGLALRGPNSDAQILPQIWQWGPDAGMLVTVCRRAWRASATWS